MARRKQISNKAQGNVAAPQEGDQKNDNSKRKYKPATNMLRAIRKEQASTKLLLKKKPFFERARAVATAINRGQPLQWTSKALDQLIDTAQQQLLERFQDSNDMRIHRGQGHACCTKNDQATNRCADQLCAAQTARMSWHEAWPDWCI
jgi:histone H3/H4